MDIAHIAALAHLDLTPEEASAMQRDLLSILDYVNQLNQIDTQGVEPMAQPLVAGSPLRSDAVQPWFSQAEAMANAPAAAHGMFEVPKILDRG
ncbi:MAG TPA: Asp-tRNA(Asn)/Glu-tRNA(Gln) amidotransferase subunit GatC [Terriglobales bacterium]|nr:Asp-tRNA(Asn)/Glu-tRNA(Gln) amidotransferase subunit GatC [Terriglobales bacterium]